MQVLKRSHKKSNTFKTSSINGRSLFLAIALMLSMAVTTLATTHAATATVTGPVPRVTFTFDDGLASALTYAAPTLAAHGISGTDYVITGCVGMVTVPNTCHADADKSYMTWEQLAQLQSQYGWELGSHTNTHPLLVSADEDTSKVLTSDEMVKELADSKAALAAHNINATSFADPYGDWNFTSLAEIAKLYSSHRPFADTITDVKHNVYPYSDYLPYVMQVQAGTNAVVGANPANVTVADVKAQIDFAKLNNQWLVLVFHNIAPKATASTDVNNYEFAQEDLDEIAAYVQAQGIAAPTMTQALPSGTNMLTNGSFESGMTGWTTDNATSVALDTGNHGSYPTPLNSIKFTSGAAEAHLFSGMTPVDPTKTYVFKAFLNVTKVATGGFVGFYVDEFDAAGLPIATQAKPAEKSVWLESMNFEYKPTSAAVARVRLQMVVSAGVGTEAYLDNVQFFDEAGGAVLKAGDVNGDNIVNIQDATLVALNWNKTGAVRADGDVSGDGVVNIQDATLISLNWSK